MTSYNKRLLSSPDIAIFKRVGQHFHCETPETAWLRQLLPVIDLYNARMDLGEFSPYLKSFIKDAESHWRSENISPMQSVQWIETTPNGRKLALSAQAVNLNDQKLLTINTHGMKVARGG